MIRLLAALCALVSAPALAAPQPVTVMVLGTWHFDNPGLDVVKMRVDDVLAPRRQREIEALADALVRFRPTRVMVEAEVREPGFAWPRYVQFSPDMLARKRDERVQVGMRVAARMGLKTVEGIDETGEADQTDYFPLDKLNDWAKAHGRSGEIDANFGRIRTAMAAFEADQPRQSIARLLLRFNDPANILASNDSYSAMLPLGDEKAQPGAVLNAMWFMRNARIFSKLEQVARPGDRVLVIYGAGHGHWLRHLAATTPGYRLEDVRPYLERAARKSGR